MGRRHVYTLAIFAISALLPICSSAASTLPQVNTTQAATSQAASSSIPSGPVAAYSFNEGTGTTVTDVSGNAITGAVQDATWTSAGKFGNALDFDGSFSYVDLGRPAALATTGSMTWSAWVYSAANPSDDGQIIALSNNTTGWQLKTSPDTGVRTFAIAVSGSTTSHTQRYSKTVPALNTWYYVAGVYDSAAGQLHIYVNGVLDDGQLIGTVPAAQVLPAGNATIGRRSGGFYFDGTIDEVRVYNRALSATEIQTDMTTPVGSTVDTQAPTVPTGLIAGSAGSAVALTWTASTDNVGVSSYLVERCQDAGCTNFAQVGSSTGTTYNDSSVTAGTTYSYRVRAADASGNLSDYSNTASATTAAPQSPTAPANLTAAAISGTQVALNWNASVSSVGIQQYLVQRCSSAGCTNFSQIATSTSTSYTDSSLSPGMTYSYQVQAMDTGSLLSPFSNIVSATTLPGAAVAYGLNEGTGVSVTDASGNAVLGTLQGATWSTSGKFGDALKFDGNSSYVDLGRPAALTSTGSMTWSAWVNSSANPFDDGQIISLSTDNVGWQLKTSPDTGVRTFAISVSGNTTAHTQRYSKTVPSLNTWYYVTGVYNAATKALDMYVNGVLDNGVLRGTIASSQILPTGNVNIGRRSGGFYFNGLIDEVRVYNRALSATEIQANMNSPVAASQGSLMSASPTSLDFGSQTAGTSSTKNVVLNNVGTSDIVVNQGALTGTAFSTTTFAKPFTISAGTSVSVPIVFAPGSAASFNESLTIVSTASNPTLSVPLTGTGTAAPQAQLVLNPTSLSFGSVNVGTTSTQSVTLTNQGTAAATLSQIVANGVGFSANGVTTPYILAPGANLTLAINFSPTTATPQTGSLSIASDAPNSPLTMAMTGTGSQPAQAQLSAAPSILAFGSVSAGTSVTKPITLTNTGTTSATINQVSATGTGFSASGINLPLTLAAGASATLQVGFQPAAASTYSGTVVVTSTAANSPMSIPVSGTGTVPAQAQLTANPASIAFGSVGVGATATQTVALVNSGNATATITQMSSSGSGFSVAGITFPYTLSAGATVNVQVTFAPTSAATYSSTLSIASNAVNSPTTVALSGTGVAAPAHSVTLTWTDGEVGVVGYNIYRGAITGGPYTKLTATPVAATTWTDTTVQAGQKYFYVLTAVSTSGMESAFSIEAPAVIPTP